MTEKDDINKKSDQAKDIFEQITPMLKDVNVTVVGAVVAALLAGFVGAHDPDDREGAVDRLMLLVSKLVRDIDKENGIEPKTEEGIRFEIAVDDTVRKEMETNPKLAEFVKHQTSRVRQALAAFQAGKFQSVDEAMRSIGLDEVDDDELEEMRERTKPGRKLS